MRRVNGRNAPSTGRLDSRYSIAKEFGGYPKQRWIVRFCGEFISSHELKYSARMAALAHKKERESAPEPAEIMAHPVTLDCMMAYRDLLDKADELLNNFGGDVPEWMRDAAIALSDASVICHSLDPKG